MAKEFLESSNIVARVFSDDVGGTGPYLLLGTGGAKLMVDKADAEKAKSLLESLNSGLIEDDDDSGDDGE